MHTPWKITVPLQKHLRLGVHSDDERPRPAAHPILLVGGPADACGNGTAFPAPSWAGDCGATAPGTAVIAWAAHVAPASVAGPGDSARSHPRMRVWAGGVRGRAAQTVARRPSGLRPVAAAGAFPRVGAAAHGTEGLTV
jgi:hypothetical protein